MLQSCRNKHCVHVALLSFFVDRTFETAFFLEENKPVVSASLKAFLHDMMVETV